MFTDTAVSASSGPGNEADTSSFTSSATQGQPRRRRFDWLSEDYDVADLSDFQRFVKDLDWSKSSLGPTATWPQWLRQMVLTVVADPSPAILYVDDSATGIESAVVYNEATVALTGSKHPTLQFADPKIAFAETWSTFSSILARGREQFETVIGEAQPVALHRHGFLEETWFSWKFSPIVGPEGHVVASLATVLENTREVLLDRRATSLQYIEHHLASAENEEDVWRRLTDATSRNTDDFPFLLVYRVDDGETSLSDKGALTTHQSSTYSLVATIEQATFQAAPKTIRLAAEDGLGALMRLAVEENCLQMVSAEELSKDLAACFRSRRYDEPCHTGVICPIQASDKSTAFAFVVLAQNPRRPWDKDYRRFVDRFTKQIGGAISRILLNEQLLRKSKDYQESQLRFSRFTSRAPLGLAIFSIDGDLTYGNDTWRQMLQYAEDSPGLDENGNALWLKAIFEDDRPAVWEAWSSLLSTSEPVVVQFRLTTPRKALNPNAPEGNLIVSCAAFADVDEAGNIQSVMSAISDISELRARTKEVEERMQYLLELKRTQENFIDMTSHEIRNPLSAVLHLAEEVFTTSHDLKFRIAKLDLPVRQTQEIKSALRTSMDAAETITACVLHQKRIVDDILVLSRLDSELLQVTPVATYPEQLVVSALRMFDAEIRSADMRLHFSIDESLRQHNIECLTLDPNRIVQILVNLVSNAIKFTKQAKTKDINVSISASLERPTAESTQVDFVPEANKERTADLFGAGDGEVIYLSIRVTDTGAGLSSEEKKVLFQRFSQGSARTHTKYGGSGLGLWIAKSLTELHGGQIGFSSEEGHGSTFLFFIRTRRTSDNPETSIPRRLSLSMRQMTDEVLQHAQTVTSKNLQPELKPLVVRTRSYNDTESSDVTQEVSSTSPIVLLVEDNLVNQRILTKQLQKQGCIVHVANHGEEALEFLPRTTFWASPPSPRDSGQQQSEILPSIPLSIVLMDIFMPTMDGLTCTKEIRRLEAEGILNQHIPIIATTANARNEQLETYYEAGMDASITKPYRVTELMAVIRQWGFRHEGRDGNQEGGARNQSDSGSGSDRSEKRQKRENS